MDLITAQKIIAKEKNIGLHKIISISGLPWIGLYHYKLVGDSYDYSIDLTDKIKNYKEELNAFQQGISKIENLEFGEEYVQALREENEALKDTFAATRKTEELKSSYYYKQLIDVANAVKGVDNEKSYDSLKAMYNEIAEIKYVQEELRNMMEEAAISWMNENPFEAKEYKNDIIDTELNRMSETIDTSKAPFESVPYMPLGDTEGMRIYIEPNKDLLKNNEIKIINLLPYDVIIESRNSGDSTGEHWQTLWHIGANTETEVISAPLPEPEKGVFYILSEFDEWDYNRKDLIRALLGVMANNVNGFQRIRFIDFRSPF